MPENRRPRRRRPLAADLRRTVHGVRSHDRLPTVAALMLTSLGFGLLVALPGLALSGLAPGRGGQLWSALWLGAIGAVVVGVLVGAPVLRGAFLVALLLAGAALTVTSVVRVGVDARSEDEREAARDTAVLLAYRLADLDGAAGADARAVVEQLCAEAGGELSQGPRWTCAVPQRGTAPIDAAANGSGWRPASLRELAIARAGAELAVAEHELSKASGTTVEPARAAVASARAALQEAKAPRVELAGALSAGVGVVVDGLLSDEDRLPLAFGVVGWVVAAVLTVALLRWVAVLNATRGLGPVTIAPLDDKDDVWGRCQERFRTYLLENVPEPGTVPNADALVQVANIVGAVVPQAAAGAKGVQALMQALMQALTVPRGFVVEVGGLRSLTTSETAADRSGGGGLVVRIRRARTRTLLDQKEFPFTGSASDLIVREAAYWAAGVVIGASRSVPAWAHWSQEAVGALAEYEHATAGGAEPDESLGHLESAARRSPNSGVVLLKLAHAREQHGPHGDFAGAFADTLEATSLYPRYLDGRYRLATEASMLAGQLDERRLPRHERGAPSPEALDRCRRTAVRHLGAGHPLTAAFLAYQPKVREAAGRPAVLGPDRDRATRRARDELRDELVRFSLHERWRTRRWLSVPALMWNCLHASERDLWLPLLLRRRLRADRQRRLVTAQLVSLQQRAEYRRHGKLPRRHRVMRRRLDNLARSGDALWQLPYNLACYYARAAGFAGERRNEFHERARVMLERARIGRDNEQLTREWVSSDPDLRSLRHADPDWWDAFLERCRTTPAVPGPHPEGPVVAGADGAGGRNGSRRRPRRHAAR